MEKVEIKPGDLYSETVNDMLERWDNLDTIWSVELGGLGPGYEQALQIAMVELCRAMQMETALTVVVDGEERFVDKWDEELHKINRRFKLGLSGAQSSAAKLLAYKFSVKGPRAALMSFKEEGMEDERLIQVDNSWPGHG